MATRVLTCDQDYRCELADALGVFDARVRSTRAAAWTTPSPCKGWTAADVVTHVIGNVYAFAAAMGGGAQQQPAGQEDLVQSWERARAVADQILSSCHDPAATVPMLLGSREMTVAFVIEALLRDVVIHTWDLARATAGDEILPEHLVTAATAALGRLPVPIRQRGYYADSLTAPPDATAQVRLLALAGRRV